jgi:hypothetical protein
MMRMPQGELVNIATPEDIDVLHLYDLHTFTHSADFAQLAPALQQHARERFQQLVAAHQLFPMNDSVALVTMSVGKPEPDWFEATFLFKVLKPVSENWRIYFFGTPVDVSQLPSEFREAGRQEWNFIPVPPTREWQPEEYVLLKRRFQALPVPYNFWAGFYQPPSRTFGIPVPTTVDLSRLGD